MRVLLIARTIKSYWETEFAKRRVTEVFAPFSGFTFWRIFGGIFAPFLYFLVTFIGFFKSGKFDLIIAADPRIGIILGILKRIFNSRKPFLVHQLILPEAKNDLKEKILKIAFEKINAAVVNSTYEAKTFEKRFPRTKFFFVPLHSDPRCFELAKSMKSNGYIFSGGGAERDFATLTKAAKGIDYSFLIVTFSPKNLPKITLPKNVQVKFNVPEYEYFKLIANSKFVVVPLETTGRSAGQTTVVQAMSAGKAVITTNVPGLADYIHDGETGILVKAGDQEALVKAIERLANNSKDLKKLSDAAFQFAQQNFTYQVYDQRIGEIFKKVGKSLKSSLT